MNLLHRRSEEMHPFEQAQVDQHREADRIRAQELTMRGRDQALLHARYHFRDNADSATPEQILSVAASSRLT